MCPGTSCVFLIILNINSRCNKALLSGTTSMSPNLRQSRILKQCKDKKFVILDRAKMLEGNRSTRANTASMNTGELWSLSHGSVRLPQPDMVSHLLQSPRPVPDSLTRRCAPLSFVCVLSSIGFSILHKIATKCGKCLDSGETYWSHKKSQIRAESSNQHYIQRTSYA